MSKDKSMNIRVEEDEWNAFKRALPPDTTAPRTIRKLIRGYIKHARVTASIDPVVEGAVKEVVDEERRSR